MGHFDQSIARIAGGSGATIRTGYFSTSAKIFWVWQAEPGASRRAFLADGEAVYIVAEGDIVLGRYSIVKINHTTLEFEETSSGRHGTASLGSKTSSPERLPAANWSSENN